MTKLIEQVKKYLENSPIRMNEDDLIHLSDNDLIAILKEV